MSFRGWLNGYPKYNKGHNGSIYKIYDEEQAQAVAEKRGSKLRGRVGWARGLTKENSDSIARAAKTRSDTLKAGYQNGTYTPWIKGKTKETDKRVAKISEGVKLAHAEGRAVAWHKGKSEKTDSRLLSKNEALRKKYEDGDLEVWHKGKTKETSPRLKRACDSRSWANFTSRKKFTEEEIAAQLKECQRTKFVGDIEDYINANTRNLKMKCNDCGEVSLQSLATARTDACPKCHRYISKGEFELREFIQDELGLRVIPNDRNVIGPHELDIYLPDHGFAVEYNGLFFHTEDYGKDSHYHGNKTAACSMKGIQLLHVWEDQWRDNPDIIRNKIRYHTGTIPNRIGARKCNLVQVSTAERKTFFNTNHIDGNVPASVAFGLRDRDGELLACLSLRRPFHRKWSGHWEVARFATKIGVSVAGGLARLTREAQRWGRAHGREGLLTYVDGAWGTGSGYLAAGWQLASVSSPTFWWTDGDERYNRFRYRADKAAGLTQAEVALQAGVARLWGCKQLVLTLS